MTDMNSSPSLLARKQHKPELVIESEVVDAHGGGKRHKVIVIGAGASGFSAAAWLLEHNITNVLMLEASDRIGGRIHTVKFGNVEIDKGAEFVHGEVDNRVFELTPRELFTSFTPYLSENNHIFADTRGKILDRTFLYPLTCKVYDILQELPKVEQFSGSVADHFEPRFAELVKSEKLDSETAETLHNLVPKLELSDDCAEDLSELGAWGTAANVRNEGDNLLKWKSLGYKTIFSILSKRFFNEAEELPVVKQTLFNKKVTHVVTHDGEVEVKCEDGSSYLADHVIVTVSLAVLKKHAADMFQPPLPDKKTVAIQTLGMGSVGKVFVRFPRRWWPKDINIISPLYSDKDLLNFKTTSEHGYWTSDIMSFWPVNQDDRSLCAWILGQGCRIMEKLSESQVMDGLFELLNITMGKAFPDIPRPEAILRSQWCMDPLVLGGWSYRSVDSDRLNITNSDLAEPLLYGDKPVILFAGEATHSQYFGTVHGAIDTGRREANRLIQYFKLK